MWDWIMRLWMVISFLAVLVVMHMKKEITWREVLFFLFGVFMAGMPLFYLVNR